MHKTDNDRPCSLRVLQADRQTDVPIAILRALPRGRSNDSSIRSPTEPRRGITLRYANMSENILALTDF